MNEFWLHEAFGIPILLWVVLYISDYALTLKGAQLYQSGAKEILSIEGSYELTPYYQPDINALRRISPRFLLALFASTVMLLLIRGLADIVRLPQFFLFACGALLLVEAALHTRHIRNIATFRLLKNRQGATGKLEYARWFSYHMSAVEMLTFTAMFLILGLLLNSWFLIGGAVGCARVAFSHWRHSRQARTSRPISGKVDIQNSGS